MHRIPTHTQTYEKHISVDLHVIYAGPMGPSARQHSDGGHFPNLYSPKIDLFNNII